MIFPGRCGTTLLCAALAACSPASPPGSPTAPPTATPPPPSTALPRCVATSAVPVAATGAASPLNIDTLAGGISNPDDLLWNGDQLYVGDLNAGRIRVLFAGESLKTLPASVPTVEGMTVLNGTLYAANQSADRVVSITGNATATVVQLTPVRGLDGIDGIGSTSTELIVPDSARGTVLLTTATGQVLRTISGFARPTDALMLADGSLVVTDENLGEIISVAPQGGRTVLASGLKKVDDLVLASDGALFAITEAIPGRLVQITGGVVTDIATALATPQGLALDDAGNLLITEATAGRVDVVLRTMRTLPLSGAVAPGSTVCITIERASGFTADVQLSGSAGVTILRQPGSGSRGVAVIGVCAPDPCRIVAQSGSLRSAIRVHASG